MSGSRDPLSYDSSRKSISGTAIASLVLGIVSIPLDIVLCSGALFGLLAVVLGITSVMRINRTDYLSGKPLAIAGIILGTISILLAIGCGLTMFNN